MWLWCNRLKVFLYPSLKLYFLKLVKFDIYYLTNLTLMTLFTETVRQTGIWLEMINNIYNKDFKLIPTILTFYMYSQKLLSIEDLFYF